MTPPIPQAATVLFLRPGATDPTPEVFTITRAASLVFSAGVSAFPGGRVDAADSLPEALWSGVDLAAWGDQFGLSAEDAGKVLACAVRETFEETGILLAQDHHGVPVGQDLLSSLSARTRQQVEDQDLDFGAFLMEHRLRPDLSTLRPLSRWVTPEGEPRRYDTYFFVAALPAGQQPGALSFEGADSRWTTAGAALADFRAGQHQLMPPTWAQFRALAGARSLHQALAVEGSAEAIMPQVLTDGPRGVVGFPGEEDFARDLAEGRAAGRAHR